LIWDSFGIISKSKSRKKFKQKISETFTDFDVILAKTTFDVFLNRHKLNIEKI
jgi:hypothetical protein